jgi:hypothetical protein
MDASVQWIDKKAKEMPMGDVHFVVTGAGFASLEHG